MFDEYQKQLNKTEDERKKNRGNVFDVEKKRLGSTKERLLKVKNNWSKKKVDNIKDELVELRELIEEILGKED